jgi:hypothetical protein
MRKATTYLVAVRGEKKGKIKQEFFEFTSFAAKQKFVKVCEQRGVEYAVAINKKSVKGA